VSISKKMLAKWTRPLKKKQYSVSTNTDIVSTCQPLLSAKTLSPPLLELLCDAVGDLCGGFTSNGALYQNVTEVMPATQSCGGGGGGGGGDGFSPKATGHAGHHAYELHTLSDVCTADLCDDFAAPPFTTSRIFQPNGRNVQHVALGGLKDREAALDKLYHACEGVEYCSGFSVGSNLSMGGWLKGGSIAVEEITAIPSSSLYIRKGGLVTTHCTLFSKL
jgi:hypothetical protein